MKIAVTGGSGKAGRAVVRDLREHGHDVLNVDRVPSHEDTAPYLPADLTDYGQTLEALSGGHVLPGIEAVVHLAAIPAPDKATQDVVFRTNITSTHTVFSAAWRLGLKRIVWASSETTLGLPFDVPPRYAPVDEDHYPVPTTTYALSKVASETIADHIAQWSGIPFIALRFSNILGPTDYQEFPSYWGDATARKWNLWGYIDERDAATACRLALEADISGSASFIIAAADTVMTRPSAELMREVFPGVPLTKDVQGTGTLLSIERAGQALGFAPQHSWRHHLSAEAVPDR